MTEALEHPMAVRRSPHAIRQATFSRERKGWDTGEVRDYLNGLAEQIEAADGERTRLRAEIDRLRGEVRRAWKGGSDDKSETSVEPDAHAVALFSQAQQVADRLIEEAVQQARDLMATARHQERDILQQAHQSAEKALATTSEKSRDLAGGGYELPVPEIEYVRTFARVAQVQLRSVLDALAEQVDRLGSLPQLEESQRSGSKLGSLLDTASGDAPPPTWQGGLGGASSQSFANPR